MENTTSSVSQGCFLFRGSEDAKKKKKKKEPTSILTGAFEPLPGEVAQDALRRKEAFRECWAAASKKIEAIMCGQHTKLLAGLVEFVKGAQRQLTAHHMAHVRADALRGERSGVCAPPRLEIPTAALVAGVNMPDHAVLFSQLKQALSTETEAYVVLLKSTEHCTGLKTTMREILSQLTRRTSKEDNDGGSDDDNEDRKRVPTKMALCSMTGLCKWYKEARVEERMEPPPSKKRKKQSANYSVDPLCEGTEDATFMAAPRPPVVMIIEDTEQFPSAVLQDLVASLSPHLAEFPVALILGLATSTATIHHHLPHAATSLLSMEQFDTQHPFVTLPQVIDELFLTPILSFRLGHQASTFLLQKFFKSNFSILNLSRGIQCAMMEHFYWQPLSFLCTKDGQGHVGHMSHMQCEMVRATPSFQRHIESLAPERQLQLLKNDNDLKAEVQKLLASLRSYYLVFFPIMRCLFHIVQLLPDGSNPFGQQHYELYNVCLERTVSEHPKFEYAWSFVQAFSRTELLRVLKLCIHELEEASQKTGAPLIEAASTLKGWADELEHLDGAQSATAGGESTVLPVVTETVGERTMRLQERLRQLSSRPKQPTAYTILRSKITDFLKELFSKHLCCPSTLPLHEVAYFNNASTLVKHLSPSPRAAIQIALSKPDHYLTSADSCDKNAGLSANLPDVCIIYQLHLECGKMINLFDWLQAFIAVVQPDKLKEKESKKKQEVEPAMQARFAQAASELQLLGFVKPTQRKTDHVQRLTWGAC